MYSVPTEMRIPSSLTPESRRSCSVSCSWVVDQGWIARVLESPTLQCVSKMFSKESEWELVILGNVGDQLEVINDLSTSGSAALDAHRQHTTKAAGQVLLCELVARVILQTGV